MYYQLGQTAFYIDLDKHGAHLVKRFPHKKNGFVYTTQLSYSNLHHLFEKLPDWLMGGIKDFENNENKNMKTMVADYQAILEELIKLVESSEFKKMKAVHAELMEKITCA